MWNVPRALILCYVEPTVKLRSMVSAQGCGHVETTLVGRSRSVAAPWMFARLGGLSRPPVSSVILARKLRVCQAILLAAAGCSAWS